MIFSGSWISATYLFINKFNALNKVINKAAYNINMERVFLFQCLKILLGHSNSGGLNVTITRNFMVYSPTERADTLLLFLLYPFLLCSGTNVG
jgi:hypothetical protein